MTSIDESICSDRLKPVLITDTVNTRTDRLFDTPAFQESSNEDSRLTKWTSLHPSAVDKKHYFIREKNEAMNFFENFF